MDKVTCEERASTPAGWYFCTEPPGHTEDHVAHDTSGVECFRWVNREDVEGLVHSIDRARRELDQALVDLEYGRHAIKHSHATDRAVMAGNAADMELVKLLAILGRDRRPRE
ncbi:MAG: hypothetical protein L0Y64_24315 [Myxococcaceae bacterium]|nr:hypothetical protein [Myxococcaceae bacterium]